jgi:hypothetical protein
VITVRDVHDMLGAGRDGYDCIGHAVVAAASIGINKLTVQREFILH